ncbi:hypothetical protein SADUNF_Sadunf02G0098900 [Salix dunnii]|uniref:Uncharacterized protein n=1 Tax=Salix dunnii TaxID=1413687 RepID=A0A835N748_9ROSI|nr:hypothetical protein SADUNF_Sadunf02G0098900 [Salix dunnii]
MALLFLPLDPHSQCTSTNFLEDDSILSYSPPSHSYGTVTIHHMNVGGDNSSNVAQKIIPISQCKNEKQKN